MNVNDLAYMLGSAVGRLAPAIIIGAIIGAIIGLVFKLVNKPRKKAKTYNQSNGLNQLDDNPYLVQPKSGRNKASTIITVIAVIGIIGAVVFNMLITDGEKDFSKAGLTITLTNSFYEKDLVAYTAYYESKEAIVLLIKEEFSIFEEAEVDTNISLAEYVEMLSYANKTDYDSKEKDGLTYFEYEHQISGKDFSYLGVVFRGEDAFWFVQFACEKKNYDRHRERFFEWAKTVNIE